LVVMLLATVPSLLRVTVVKVPSVLRLVVLVLPLAFVVVVPPFTLVVVVELLGVPVFTVLPRVVVAAVPVPAVGVGMVTRGAALCANAALPPRAITTAVTRYAGVGLRIEVSL
jgi:hypothetical protein